MPQPQRERISLSQKFVDRRTKYLEDLLQNPKARRIKESIDRLPNRTHQDRIRLFTNFMAFYRTRAALRSACNAIEMPLSLQRKLFARLIAKKGKLVSSVSMPGVDSREVRSIVFNALQGHLSEHAWGTFRREWIDFDKQMQVVAVLDMQVKNPKKRSDSPTKKDSPPKK
jgi:hypothetical protein